MRLIATLTLFALCATAHADYQKEIDAFFTLCRDGRSVEALDALYATNPWISESSDAVANVKSQLAGLEQIVGDFHGQEKLGERNVKDRFVHVTYLALYDRQPVRMEFQFWRPKDEWMVFSFSFDVNFDDEIELAERARIASGE